MPRGRRIYYIVTAMVVSAPHTPDYISLHVEGEPRAESRPRMSRWISRLGRAVMYSPSRPLRGRFASAIAIALSSLGIHILPFFVGHVEIRVVFGVRTDNKDLDNMTLTTCSSFSWIMPSKTQVYTATTVKLSKW